MRFDLWSNLEKWLLSLEQARSPSVTLNWKAAAPSGARAGLCLCGFFEVGLGFLPFLLISPLQTWAEQ